MLLPGKKQNQQQQLINRASSHNNHAHVHTQTHTRIYANDQLARVLDAIQVHHARTVALANNLLPSS